MSNKGNRQYAVKVDSTGNTTLRNRRHIREMPQDRSRDRDRFLPTARVRGNSKTVPPATRTSVANPVSDYSEPTNQVVSPTESQQTPSSNMLPQVNQRVPRALSRLLPFNNPGRREAV